LRRLACRRVQGLDDVGVSGRDRLAPESHGGGDLVAAGLPGDRQDGEPLDLLDPEQLAVGGLDRQAPEMMLRIVESSHFTAYNAGESRLGDGAR
jgi:hypothetical protein